MSSILEQVGNIDSANISSTDVNFALNELAELQNGVTSLQEALQFTPEMVPVVKYIDESGTELYIVENDLFQKMLKSQQISVEEGIMALYDHISSNPDNDIETTAEMAIAIKEENIDNLANIISEDVSKSGKRYKSIKNHINYLQEIRATGCDIVFVPY